jgi:hypothetical protein
MDDVLLCRVRAFLSGFRECRSGDGLLVQDTFLRQGRTIQLAHGFGLRSGSLDAVLGRKEQHFHIEFLSSIAEQGDNEKTGGGRRQQEGSDYETEGKKSDRVYERPIFYFCKPLADGFSTIGLLLISSVFRLAIIFGVPWLMLR